MRASAALLASVAALAATGAARDLRCETCQVMGEIAAGGMAKLPKSYLGARDVGAMDVLEGLCEWSAWADYAGKAGMRTHVMVDECERLRDELEEEIEEAMVRKGATGLAVRTAVCGGACPDGLWADGDEPDARESPADRNEREGAAFRAEYAKRDGAVELESGLLYRVIEAGEEGAPSPGPDDEVEVHYRGTLTDGREFDSSYSRGEPASFAVGGVVRGWTEALQLMRAGAEWELVLPSELAYGPSGSGDDIGPGATLVFQVKLLSIKGGGGGGKADL